MFERYTEKARRVIFYARYEASQYGSSYIETEHLLLGLLREDKALTMRMLRSESSIESIRQKIDKQSIFREKVPTSVDLPLSNEAKRVLAFAAEEAERIGDRHIGTEHLLLGLLRETKSFGAELLNGESVHLDRARQDISEWKKKHGIAQEAAGSETVEIHGHKWNLGYVRAQVSVLGRFAWRKREWQPQDVLVEREGDRVFFDVNLHDDPDFELRPGGWNREWCAICNWELNTENPEHSFGYTNGRQWLCMECYERFFSRKTDAA